MSQQSVEISTVEMFTDGACRGNPGPGGWGVVLRHNGAEKALCGGEPSTTNNRMELMAAIRGLESLTRPCRVVLTTDSKYVMTGMTEWLANWKRRGWKTANKGPVKNVELWQRLDLACQPHQLEWRWVRGHTGHRENEMADRLANQGLEEALR